LEAEGRSRFNLSPSTSGGSGYLDVFAEALVRHPLLGCSCGLPLSPDFSFASVGDRARRSDSLLQCTKLSFLSEDALYETDFGVSKIFSSMLSERYVTEVAKFVWVQLSNIILLAPLNISEGSPDVALEWFGGFSSQTSSFSFLSILRDFIVSDLRVVLCLPFSLLRFASQFVHRVSLSIPRDFATLDLRAMT
jgi:hypothetical protein